ncbi:MAG: Aspartyl/glutamyl-tRNA(Asn/Gln) amidotransferase subunit C [Phycisphaerae bacterium]|nr:Aspartyl/glutamyl-tRNA(Asn/Gln) amidotransferase subunit C [Phycisphaerae bacterium]
MSLTLEDVRRVAHLARLNLAETEEAAYVGQLASILDYFERLGAAPTADVPPTVHALALQDVLRDDLSRDGCGPGLALRNAPSADQGFFKVPKVLADGGA